MFGSHQEQRRSIARNVLVAAAALVAIGGVSTLGTVTTNAATPQCGSSCVGIFSNAFGSYANPGFVETVRDGFAKAGQPTELFAASSSNPAEDFIAHTRPVSAFFADGMVSAAVSSKYSGLNATQVEYAPLGVGTGLCSAVESGPHQNEGLTLQACTVPGTTVWIIDTMDSPMPGFFALVSGANHDLVRPYAMTMNGDPRNGPVQIQVDHLKFDPHTGKIAQATQLWGAKAGPLQ
jgi:hypothetical protein